MVWPISYTKVSFYYSFRDFWCYILSIAVIL
jgi:hypothetical protein